MCAFTECVVTCVFAHMDPSGKKDDLELIHLCEDARD